LRFYVLWFIARKPTFLAFLSLSFRSTPPALFIRATGASSG
jgi:hypothetical protein